MDIPAVARAAIEAAESRLRTLVDDPSLTHCFWLLARVAWAARSPSFATAVGDLGLDPARSPSAVGFIAQVADAARAHARDHPESGPYAELASLALRHALSDTVGQTTKPLFESSVDDVRVAFRPYASQEHFGTLAKRFFGDLLARTLRFFVDREVANQMGAGRPLATIAQRQAFTEALDLYTRQSATIVERFSADWYGKNNWESRGEISREDAHGFVAHALRKLRAELRQAHT
jgi:hypothetical protein